MLSHKEQMKWQRQLMTSFSITETNDELTVEVGIRHGLNQNRSFADFIWSQLIKGQTINEYHDDLTSKFVVKSFNTDVVEGELVATDLPMLKQVILDYVA